MPAFPATSSIAGSRTILMTGAAAIFLSGCAVDPVPDLGRSTSACRANTVAYCEVDRHLDSEKCRCVWRGSLRGYLRDFSRL